MSSNHDEEENIFEMKLRVNRLQRQCRETKQQAVLWEDLCITLGSLLLRKHAEQNGGRMLTPGEVFCPIRNPEISEQYESYVYYLAQELQRRF